MEFSFYQPRVMVKSRNFEAKVCFWETRGILKQRSASERPEKFWSKDLRLGNQIHLGKFSSETVFGVCVLHF